MVHFLNTSLPQNNIVYYEYRWKWRCSFMFTTALVCDNWQLSLHNYQNIANCLESASFIRVLLRKSEKLDCLRLQLANVRISLGRRFVSDKVNPM